MMTIAINVIGGIVVLLLLAIGVIGIWKAPDELPPKDREVLTAAICALILAMFMAAFTRWLAGA